MDIGKIEKKNNNFFVAKSRINFSLWELEFSGNMYFSYTERLASSKVEKVPKKKKKMLLIYDISDF